MVSSARRVGLTVVKRGRTGDTTASSCQSWIVEKQRRQQYEHEGFFFKGGRWGAFLLARCGLYIHPSIVQQWSEYEINDWLLGFHMPPTTSPFLSKMEEKQMKDERHDSFIRPLKGPRQNMTQCHLTGNNSSAVAPGGKYWIFPTTGTIYQSAIMKDA